MSRHERIRLAAATGRTCATRTYTGFFSLAGQQLPDSGAQRMLQVASTPGNAVLKFTPGFAFGVCTVLRSDRTAGSSNVKTPFMESGPAAMTQTL